MKSSQAHIKSRPSLLRQGVLTAFCLTCVGSLVLVGFAVFLWVTLSFEEAAARLSRLAFLQSSVFSEFEEASFSHSVKERLFPKMQELTQPWLLKTQQSQANLKTFSAKSWHSIFGESDLVENGEFATLIDDLKQRLSEGWFLLGKSLQILLIKFAILLAALPLFALSILAGLVDGLNQRAIRTASLGRESTYVFHKSIPIARKLLLLALGLWLSLPIPLHPSILFIGISVLLSVVVSMSASRFKKYL
ncbi:MAG: DUF4400 domain-containing protein [Tatlockia sp.]|nr:DUF4400 domain-containing protein [Tatlockia sp.]